MFENLFAAAGANLYERLNISPVDILARHFWPDGSQLDLFADLDKSIEAITQFAGTKEAEAFINFHQYAEDIYNSVSDVFIHAPKPSPLKMIRQMGLSIVPKLIKADIHHAMWTSISRYFKDERLRQLFGRYATYTGNNPFITPATFNLIASVEQNGVWHVEGGISALAEALKQLLVDLGGEVRTRCEVVKIISNQHGIEGVKLSSGETILTEQVIFNGDIQALTNGTLISDKIPITKPYPKSERSLSAMTLCTVAHMSSAPLIHHNVWFSRDYQQEFNEIESGHLPIDPTIYLCAQDRFDHFQTPPHLLDVSPPERLFVLVNAPARADYSPLDSEEIAQCQATIHQVLQTLNVNTSNMPHHWMTPREWHHKFPYSGGAIYGQANKRWDSSLKRMGTRTVIKGLYLVGGSVHPGAGVPMTAISGRIAAKQLIKDYALIDA